MPCRLADLDSVERSDAGRLDDAWHRSVLGWSIADHMRSELVADAIDVADARRTRLGVTTGYGAGPSLPIKKRAPW